jgi:hypothetical protein
MCRPDGQASWRDRPRSKEIEIMDVTTEEPAGATAIRPFRFEAPEAELEELRARIRATRWPEKETVADDS